MYIDLSNVKFVLDTDYYLKVRPLEIIKWSSVSKEKQFLNKITFLALVGYVEILFDFLIVYLSFYIPLLK